MGCKRAISSLIDMFNRAIGRVVDGTADMVVTAASKTPGLKEIVVTKVHRSFHY